MRRRDFITLLGGAAAAWPLAARAQQPERARRIGMLLSNSPDDPQTRTSITAFMQEFQKAGWVEGRNVQIDYRWPLANPERIRTYAMELVALEPDVIVTSSNQ